MRVAVLADIHGNAAALQAVLADLDKHTVDDVWFLGDVCGYGPLPVTCINLLDVHKPGLWLMGNHDWATLEMLGQLTSSSGSIDQFGCGKAVPFAEERKVASWHARQLQRGLPMERIRALGSASFWTAVEHWDGCYVAHGAVLDLNPHSVNNVIGKNSYIHPGYSEGHELTLDVLERSHAERGSPVATTVAVGHYHAPCWMQVLEVKRGEPRQWDYRYPSDLPFNGEALAAQDLRRGAVLFSPGSVGRARDGDVRAAYAILDSETAQVWFRRVEYDFREYLAALMPLFFVVSPQDPDREKQWQRLCGDVEAGR
jgi:predicted phosphodiesterase